MFSLAAANFLGLLKLRLYAALFNGASSNLGVFLASDRIPNFVFNILAIGAMSTSFIPVFSRTLSEGKKARAFEMASTLFNLSFIFFLFAALVFFLFSRPILAFFSWGGDLTLGENQLLNQSSKILFLAQLFFLFSAFSSGILQSFGKFTAVAFSPIAFNLTVIISAAFLAPRFGVLGAAWATVLGSLAHFLVQLPTLYSVGFIYRPFINIKDKLLKEIGVLFLPQTLSLVVDQLAALFLTSFSLSLSASSVVILSFAQRLELIPVALFGAAFFQASFARLSREAVLTQGEFLQTFRKTFYYLSFLILPSAAFLIVLKIPLVRIFFGSRGFDWNATLLTAQTLSLFAVGLFFQAQSGFLARAFFALKNTRIPLFASFFSLVFGVAFAFISLRIFNFGVWSLALSASLIDLIDFLILYYFLSGKFRELRSSQFLKPIFLMAFSAVLSGGLSYFLVRQLDLRFSFFDTRYLINLLVLTGLSIFAGSLAYLLISYKLGINEGRKIIIWLSKIRGFGQTFLSEIFQE